VILRFVCLSPSRSPRLSPGRVSGLGVGTNNKTSVCGQAHPRPLPQAGGETI